METNIASGITISWNERTEAFAKATGKTVEDINTALSTLVGTPGDDVVGLLSDTQALSDDDLKVALVTEGPKVPLGLFKKNLVILRGPAPEPVVTSSANPGVAIDILPTVPEDNSFIELLKTGGVLKVGTTEVLSAVKAAMANNLGLYDLPEIIKNKMESFAEEQEEPVGEEYFKLQKLVTTRSYAEVLSALNIEGSFMSEAKKKKLLQKLDECLWPALRTFNDQLMSWQTAWTSTVSNPALIMSAMVMGQTGNASVMPPGIVQMPETAGLHDEAEAVINSINKVFSGVGIPVSRALAYDATRIKGVLENSGLPAAVGATNRDQMLKMLGISVGADYVRLERNITRFTLAIMEFPKITVSTQEYSYLAAMIQLGTAIPWDKLGIKGARPTKL